VYKFFLSGVLFVAACFSLNAAEGDCHSALDSLKDCYCGLDPLKDCHCGLDPQSPFIYIADNTPIYNPDLISAKQTDSINNHKKVAGVKKKTTPAPTENKIAEHEPDAVVLPAFPFSPSSSTFLQGGRELATISLQPKYDRQQPAAKTCRENTYRRINNADLSLYHLKQRQKLSTAATQCGMLTSFASTSPPAIKSLSLRA